MGASTSKLSGNLVNACFTGDQALFASSLKDLHSASNGTKSEDEILLSVRDLPSHPQFKGDSLLHIACRFNSEEATNPAKFELIKNLLDRKIFDLNEKNPVTGRTPLHCACATRMDAKRGKAAGNMIEEVIRLLLQEGAICCGADKITIDADGYDPLMLATWSGLVGPVRELVGRGARVGPTDRTFGQNALHLAFQDDCEYSRVDICSMLECLLPVASNEARHAIAKSPAGFAAPFGLALIASKQLGADLNRDGGVRMIQYLLKNGINFFQDVMSYQIVINKLTTTPLMFQDSKTKAFDIFRDLGRTIETNKSKISPELTNLFFAENDDTNRQLGVYRPWAPSFQYTEASWNANVKDSPLVDWGRASLLVAAIVLVRFDVFKFLIKEYGFSFLLKPVEATIVGVCHRAVPLYILAAAEINEAVCMKFLNFAFDNADAESLKGFSAFKNYAGEDMTKLMELGNSGLRKVVGKQPADVGGRYCTFDYSHHRDPALTYIVNLPPQQLETANNNKITLSSHSVNVFNEKSFVLLYYSASHIQNRVHFLNFFVMDSATYDASAIPKMMSVFTKLERVQLCGNESVSDAEFQTFYEYVNAETGHGLRDLYLSDANRARMPLTPSNVLMFSQSKALQHSLRNLIIPSRDFFFEADSDDSEKIFLEKFASGFSALTYLNVNKCTPHQVEIIESLSKKWKEGSSGKKLASINLTFSRVS